MDHFAGLDVSTKQTTCHRPQKSLAHRTIAVPGSFSIGNVDASRHRLALIELFRF